ncbi:MAG: hypothetical protein DELT_02631 [Desulfovibrio sp.]
MYNGYIIVKTRQGLEMAKTCKAVDRICERLEIICLERPYIGMEQLTIAVWDFCDETNDALNEVSQQFHITRDGMNSGYYRQVVKDSKYGKRRRMKMRTYCGDRLFKLTVSADRMCIVVAMLAREQRITPSQAGRFYEGINRILKQLTKVRMDLGKVLRNAENGVISV